ncbi:MAG: large subunit ribosomal protein L18 [Parcubacteria group bacterium Gr01-1014_18]|nr:MAG: large subunit ribosomal protein L18 [Parcubacteria group bacterium Greene0416_36]TSC80267.1 MAG: large subunit ribosomal protein L18 [Parcubacteria group bacterium Gr01-1014_18]TSC98246.1 MAG: large subunit ribosomal protein L18 [Parcubacteria group bacterium Greene1014_20]TSD07011.1 MAG: large subunit ribosomal protein L18 [Parcubacteria group bacterium Greene0714_2]
MNPNKKQAFVKLRRKNRVSFKIREVSSRPRLSVAKTLRHIYAQVIDDQSGRTLVAASNRDKNIVSLKLKTKTECSAAVGESIAKKAVAKGIIQVVFDRGASKYHGRVQALAEGARKNGLIF